MKIFLSAPSRDLMLAQEIISKLEAEHHEVYDWISVFKSEVNNEDPEIVANFIRGLAYVANCDMFILVVTSPGGPSVGSAMELGVAMAHHCQSKLLELITIDDSCPWCRHPGRLWFTQRAYTKTVFRRVDDLIHSLERR